MLCTLPNIGMLLTAEKFDTKGERREVEAKSP